MKSLLYPVPPIPVGAPPAGFEEMVFNAERDTNAIGWLRVADEGDDTPAVIFFHGNGENLETLRMSGALETLCGLEAHCLALDYPGYGRSAGEPSEAGLVETGKAALRRLHNRFPKSRVYLVGWSLGAAVAAQVARGEEIDGLALLSPWTRLQDVAETHYPSWMVRMFLRESYDTVAALEGSDVPLVVIHGESDGIIPFRLGRSLAESVQARPDRRAATRFVSVPGAGHNDLLDRREVWIELATLLGGR